MSLLSSLVDKFYEMDPKTEDLVYSSKLENRMVVLIEDPDLRQDIAEIKYETRSHRNGPQSAINPHALAKARMTNRWSEVSELEITDEYVMFIAIYEDDVKRVRINDLTVGWIVKLISMPV